MCRNLWVRGYQSATGGDCWGAMCQPRWRLVGRISKRRSLSARKIAKVEIWCGKVGRNLVYSWFDVEHILQNIIKVTKNYKMMTKCCPISFNIVLCLEIWLIWHKKENHRVQRKHNSSCMSGGTSQWPLPFSCLSTVHIKPWSPCTCVHT